MTLSTTGRYVSVIVVTFSFLACATPPNIREKSAAGNALYTDVLAAHRTFTSALAEELTRRDIAQAENAVRVGEAKVALEEIEVSRRYSRSRSGSSGPSTGSCRSRSWTRRTWRR
jgi:hypothetical protein